MADTMFLATEEDARKLRELIRSSESLLTNLRSRTGNTGNTIEMEGSQSPEVYIGLTPGGGIPACSGTTPGSASCTLYVVNYARYAPVIEQIGQVTETVFNLGPSAIDEDLYILVIRDKSGVWIGIDLFPVKYPYPLGNPCVSTITTQSSGYVTSVAVYIYQVWVLSSALDTECRLYGNCTDTCGHTVEVGEACCPIYYCVDGVIVSQTAGGDAPAGTIVLGPWLTEFEAEEAGCVHDDDSTVSLTTPGHVGECCSPVPTVPGSVWLNFSEATGDFVALPNSGEITGPTWDGVSKWNYTPFSHALGSYTFITSVYVECITGGFRVHITQSAMAGGTSSWDPASGWSGTSDIHQDFICGNNWVLDLPEEVGTFTHTGGSSPIGSYKVTVSR